MISEEAKDTLLSDLKNFMETCEIEGFHFVVLVHKWKDNQIMTNSCLPCHVETLIELIKTKDIKHNHADTK